MYAHKYPPARKKTRNNILGRYRFEGSALGIHICHVSDASKYFRANKERNIYKNILSITKTCADKIIIIGALRVALLHTLLYLKMRCTQYSRKNAKTGSIAQK